MGKLLNSSETGDESKKQIIGKWSNLGFLDGLVGHIKPSIAALYESGPSKLLDEKPKPWFVYILWCKDGSLYTGITNDIHKRLEKHNNGTGAKYTRGRGPVSLAYLQRYDNKSLAAKEEFRIKKLRKLQKLELIGKWNKKNFDGPITGY